MKTKLISILPTLLLLASPAVALAANHQYTCADFAYDFGGHSCSVGVFTFTTDGGMIDSNSSINPPGAGGSANFPLTQGATYYVYAASMSGSGKIMLGSYYYTAGGNFGNDDLLTEPGSGNAWSFSVVKNTGAGLYFQVSAGTWSPGYSGTFGPVCISNVSAADAQALCSSGGGSSGPFSYVKNAVQDFRYTYDKVGNITGIDNQATSTTAAATTIFSYDQLNRLVMATTTYASSSPFYRFFSYDALGSITGANNGTATTTYTYGGTGYANPHAVTSYGGNTYGYDSAGNLTSASSSTFTYDYKNRMTQAVTNGTTTNYTYAHDVNRVTQTTANTTTIYPSKYYSITSTKSGATTTATTTEYVYNGDTLIATIDQVLINGTATGSPITSFIYPDHLGSTNVVANSSGKVVQTMDYVPYGATRINTTNSSVKEKRGYIGQFADASSLNYLNARYYDAARGQFTSEDPVFWEVGQTKDGKDAMLNPQAFNSYGYANDNPIVSKDPQGRIAPLIAAFIGEEAISTIVSAYTYYNAASIAVDAYSASINLRTPGSFTPLENREAVGQVVWDAIPSIGRLGTKTEKKIIDTASFVSDSANTVSGGTVYNYKGKATADKTKQPTPQTQTTRSGGNNSYAQQSSSSTQSPKSIFTFSITNSGGYSAFLGLFNPFIPQGPATSKKSQ